MGCYALAGALLTLNTCVHHRPAFLPMEEVSPNADLMAQVNFLRSALSDGAAAEMQQLYPEGRLFMNAVSLLAIDQTPYQTSPEFTVSLANDTADRYLFPADLPLPHGAFYRGWRNYAYRNDDSLLTEVSSVLRRSRTPFLESYRSSAWPADMTVLMASLPRGASDSLRAEWVRRVRQRLDSATGMIPHSVDPINGYQLEPPRGSSMALMLCLLPEIDTAFAREQYALFRRHLLTTRLGFPAVREYPRGRGGSGDIDSGPVIWGVGGVASIVGQRVVGLYGDHDTFVGLRGAIQAFGLAHTWRGKRRYLFGQLPVVDAFTAWANSVDAYEGPVDGRWVPWRFHLLSLVLVAGLGWLGWRMK